MPVFPSREWVDEAVRLANADPQSATAGKGWKGDFGLVVEAEAGKLARPFVVHLVPRDGRIDKVMVLRDPDELEELEPAYLARAPYSTWKALIVGTLDPLEAILGRKLAVQGELQPLVERAQFKGIGDRVLAKLETIFVDEAA